MPVHIKRDGSTYLSVHRHQAHICVGAVTAELKSSLQFNPGESSKGTPGLLYPGRAVFAATLGHMETY